MLVVGVRLVLVLLLVGDAELVLLPAEPVALDLVAERRHGRVPRPGQEQDDSTSLQRGCAARARSRKKPFTLRDRSER